MSSQTEPTTSGARGRSAVAALALAFVLAFAVEASAETSVSSPHVALSSDVAYGPLLQKLVATIESALPLLERHVPGLALAQGQKLAFHLYARRDDYARVCEQQLAHAMKERAGFTAIGGESHLLLEPRSEPAFLARVGDLPETTALLACHEAVHQWLARSGGAPNDALLPAWYCEGMAEHVSALSAGAEAIHATEKPRRALEALASNSLPSLWELLHADLERFERRSLLYSCAASFYALLAREPEKLARLHEAVRALPAPPGTDRSATFAASCARVLEDIYGPLDVLEERWRAALAKTEVAWFEDGACSQLIPGGVVCAGSPLGDGAILLSGRRPAGESVSLTCELEVLGLGSRAAGVFLAYEGRSDRRYLEIALSRDEESSAIALEAYSDGRFRPELGRRALLPRGTLAPGSRVPLEVSADRASIRVTSRGAVLLVARVPEGFDVLHGRWGLGARDEVAVFTRVQGP
jgi:hypothetical protein